MSQRQAAILGVLLLFILLTLIVRAMMWRGKRKPLPEKWHLPAVGVMASVLAPVWLGLVGFAIWALIAVATTFPEQIEKAATDGDGLRWHVLAFVGLVTALGGLVGAPLALIRVWTTERQTVAAEEGLITERINKAVANLGTEKSVKRQRKNSKGKLLYRKDESGNLIFEEPVMEEVTEPNLEVRIGAIYALERIARDSARDHIQVMEILCAYIRQNAPASGAQDHDLPDWEPLADDAPEQRQAHQKARDERFGGFAFTHSRVWQWAQSLPPLRTDLQTALDVIGRRDDAQIAIERAARVRGSKVGYCLDLRATNLQKADLSELALDHALLTGARMEGADLGAARMEGAYLRAARMEGAYLGAARMEGANLGGARMEGANLEGVRMEGADLRAARMEGAYLGAARFDEKTNFTAAVVQYAAVKSVSFVGIALDQDQVNALFGDGSVTLPEGLTRPAHWPEDGLDWQDFYDQWRAWQRENGYTPRE